ncbi:DUF6916 family protein [Sphingomonas sp. M1A8_2b]
MTPAHLDTRAIAIDEFIPMVGRTLLADCDPCVAELVLVAVHPHDRQISARISFTLVFRSESEIQLVTGMYRLRSRNFGPDTVYIEPMIPPCDAVRGNYYQAVFN